MSNEVSAAPARTGAEVNVSSYMNGNRMEVMHAETVADILTVQQINTTECQIDVQDAHGNEKPGRASTRLTDGDTVQIMRHASKSGSLNGQVTHLVQGEATPVTKMHKLPLERTNATIEGSRSKYRFHECNEIGTSFDVPFTVRYKKDVTRMQQKISSAATYYTKRHPRTRFTNRLFLKGAPGFGKRKDHTHLIRVWRIK